MRLLERMCSRMLDYVERCVKVAARREKENRSMNFIFIAIKHCRNSKTNRFRQKAFKNKNSPNGFNSKAMDDRQSHVSGAGASQNYSSDTGEILAHFRCETFTHIHRRNDSDSIQFNDDNKKRKEETRNLLCATVEILGIPFLFSNLIFCSYSSRCRHMYSKCCSKCVHVSSVCMQIH